MQMRTRCHSSTMHLDANATLHACILLDAQCASASCAALRLPCHQRGLGTLRSLDPGRGRARLVRTSWAARASSGRERRARSADEREVTRRAGQRRATLPLSQLMSCGHSCSMRSTLQTKSGRRPSAAASIGETAALHPRWVSIRPQVGDDRGTMAAYPLTPGGPGGTGSRY